MKRVDELLEMGQKTLSTRSHVEFVGNVVDSGAMKGFRTAVLSFIDMVYGKEHPHFQEFILSTTKTLPRYAENGIGILQAIRSEIAGGWIFTMKDLITAEVFADFIEMAEHLLETGSEHD